MLTHGDDCEASEWVWNVIKSDTGVSDDGRRLISSNRTSGDGVTVMDGG